MLIIAGLFLIVLGLPGGTTAISMLSVSSQSRLLNISTSTSIKAMIALQWNLAKLRMKSSFIWMHADGSRDGQMGENLSLNTRH
jgi:hypothetical protein